MEWLSECSLVEWTFKYALTFQTFKSSGNSIVFKKGNDAKLFALKSYLAIKIYFIGKLWREKNLSKNVFS